MPRITEMYAWIVADTGPDDEGIIAASTPNGWMMPLIGADRARVESLREMAATIARAKGKTAVLKRFAEGVEIDRVAP